MGTKSGSGRSAETENEAHGRARIALRVTAISIIGIGAALIIFALASQEMDAFDDKDWFEKGVSGMFPLFMGGSLFLIAAALLRISFSNDINWLRSLKDPDDGPEPIEYRVRSVCPACDHPVKKYDHFCSNCGARL